MNKTAAIRAARRAVTQPIGRGTSWMLIGHYRSSDINGPSTQVNADSYYRARAERTQWVAHIALVLMGYNAEDAAYWTQSERETTINGLVDACIAKMT